MHEERSATTRDGRTLTYTAVGTGPMLVCVPGGPGFDGAYFEDLAGLADARTIVRVNPAGTAGSDPWTEDAWSPLERAHDLEDLRQSLGLEQLDLLGHSAGGWVVARYAAAYPARVRRLLLVGTMTRFSEELRAALLTQARLHEDEPWFEHARRALAQRMAGDYATDDEFLELYRPGFRFYFARYGEAERAFVARIERWIDRRSVESFNEHADELDLRPYLRAITAETLVVNGEHDAARALEHEWLDGIGGSRPALVEGAAHFPWIEQPARFRAAVGSFLSG